MIKAVFFDVDGTLVAPETGGIPQSTAAALHTLAAKGIKLFVATGRHRQDLVLMDELPFDGALAMNGQFCTLGETVIRKHTFAPEELTQVLQVLEGKGFPLWYMAEDRWYINGRHPAFTARYKTTGRPVPPVLHHEDVPNIPIYQLCAYLTDPAQQEQFIAAFEGFFVTRSAPHCIDVLPAGGGKDRGIAAVAHHLGIQREETMAFGDGHNDIAMLEYAGIGVAMGNADAKLKGCADYVTKPVHEGGIAYGLQHFGLL